jgi:hypothetical protein
MRYILFKKSIHDQLLHLPTETLRRVAEVLSELCLVQHRYPFSLLHGEIFHGMNIYRLYYLKIDSSLNLIINASNGHWSNISFMHCQEEYSMEIISMIFFIFFSPDVPSSDTIKYQFSS